MARHDNPECNVSRPSDEKQDRESLCVTWGEGNPTVENYSPGFSCLNSDCRKYGITERDWTSKLVGCKEAPEQMKKAGKNYALICECPSCFEKFWFHANQDTAELFKDLYLLGKCKLKP